MIVAVDGPVGAGKSTVARNVAKKLGFSYVDTGAMYRAIGLYCYEHKVNMDDAESIAKASVNARVELVNTKNGQRTLLNGKDVSDKIRLPEIAMATSKAAAVPEVRSALVKAQRKAAESADVIMDGRDIGTCVFPDADVKIFLTASPEIRAERRFRELRAKGSDTDYETVLKELKERDYIDSHREITPLRMAEDAVMVDTSDLDFDETCAKICDIIKEKM